MDTAQLDALINLLRDDPHLCEQVLKAPDREARAHLLQRLGFAVNSQEAPDKGLLVESLGLNS
jgi:hypothetical protein